MKKRKLMVSSFIVLSVFILSIMIVIAGQSDSRQNNPWLRNGNDIDYDNGNVGIGTTSPRSDARLDVGGHVRMGTLTVDDFINGNGSISVWGLGGEGWLGLVHAYQIGGQWETEEWRLDIDRTGDRTGTDDFIISTESPPGTIPFMIQRSTNNVGIGTTNPQERLDVEGNVEAWGYITGDIVFQKEGKKLWRMFEEEDGLYLENLKTGKVSKVFLEEDLVYLKEEIMKEVHKEIMADLKVLLNEKQ